MAEAKSAHGGGKSGKTFHGGSRKRLRSEGKDRGSKRRHRRTMPSLTAFEVFYGGDISDPLNLNAVDQDGFDSQSADDDIIPEPVVDSLQTTCELSRTDQDPLNLLADARRAKRREKKKQHRKMAAIRREEKRKQSTGDEEEEADGPTQGKRARKRSLSKDGESTAEEETGQPTKRKRKRRKSSPVKEASASAEAAEHTFRPQDARFALGNYNRYYGYRNPSGQSDERLKCFPKSLFSGKRVLDIGCNTGHVTLSIAKDFAPSQVLGVDIDQSLVDTAERNVRHYFVPSSDKAPLPVKRDFPMSFKLAYGPLASPFIRPPVQPVAGKAFPLNVAFRKENYVEEGMEKACSQTVEYDVILALSITKWIHLNWGDSGVETLFHRIYHHLSPGGVLLLEPQVWQSYARRSKLTATTLKHYQAIKMTPEQFNDYLLNQVGFASLESLPTPKHSAKGFQRPVFLCTKSESSDQYCNLCRPKQKSVTKKRLSVRVSTDNGEKEKDDDTELAEAHQSSSPS